MTVGCAERQADEATPDTTTVGPLAPTDTAVISRRGSSSDQPNEPGDAAATGSRPIYALLLDDARFSTFVEAVEVAGLPETLTSGGPYTVFAPSDDAFGRMELSVQELLGGANVDRLRDILLHHISNSETTAANLTRAPLRSLSGYDIQVDESGGLLRANGAQITESDLSASNGVVHVIDAVLLPDADEDDQ